MLCLASSSPRRRDLLRDAQIDFRLCEPGVEVDGAGAPSEVAMQRARSKARGARAASGDTVLGVDTVLAVDTVVAIGDLELGKPRDREDARRMLELLSGRCHEVHSAHCVVRDGVERTALATSRVRCEILAAPDIDGYLDCGEWTDKAGGYGIQGAAGAFMRLESGDLDTVIGLSVDAVRRLLEEVGCRPPS